jgi:hypothetical protein
MPGSTGRRRNLAEVDGNYTLWKEAKEATTTVLHWAGKFRGVTFDPITFTLEIGTCAKLVDHKGRQIPSVWAHPADDATVERDERNIRERDDAVLLAMSEGPGGASLSGLAILLAWKDSGGKPQKYLVQRSMERLVKAKLVTLTRERYELTAAGKKEAKRLRGQAT